ncbi:Yip1 domain-containing protein [Poseidonocella pacifica]|uniref:Yip1 domain-containing protein n=1 Tax=Poseidonocella pacifica TaxID=871651 RepID=A0A1I0YM87_9RHOB|nr:YIP1 family protein [Poseidonocella pacifica]SFB14525.1 Yip1 domain-containing protein [Poseidonocella pacifica]
MPVASDIVATYRGPGRVMRRLLAGPPREDRALAYLMGGCVLTFVAQWPRLARDAHLEGTDINPTLGGALLAWVFIAPLAFYALASVSHLVARLFGGRGSFYGTRIALFWSWLAAAPILLLHGLTAGFVGAGPALQTVGLVWLGVFLWFWLSGLRIAETRADLVAESI